MIIKILAPYFISNNEITSKIRNIFQSKKLSKLVKKRSATVIQFDFFHGNGFNASNVSPIQEPV